MSLGATIGCVTCDVMADEVLHRGEVDDVHEAADVAVSEWELPPLERVRASWAQFIAQHRPLSAHQIVACNEDGVYQTALGVAMIGGGRR